MLEEKTATVSHSDHLDDTAVDDGDSNVAGESLYSSERFDVTSYGWDVDVEGLVRRMNSKEINIPGFQRGFVWSKPERSRFIESLILGLPVPTLFLARDAVSNHKLNVIDGQQRLKTLQSYLNGDFPLSGSGIPEDLKGRFHSSRRAPRNGRAAYPNAKILERRDERTLSDAIVHAIVIRQNPRDDEENRGSDYNKAIIQIFKRLNTSGKALVPQEVRASIFHGPLLDLIRDLNQNSDWRSIFGREHSRMKDQEAILRILALFHSAESYKSPMPRFLDWFMDSQRNVSETEAKKLKRRAETAIGLAHSELDPSAFKRGGTFLLTIFDAVVVGLMHAISEQDLNSNGDLIVKIKQKLGGRTVHDRLTELLQDNRGLDDTGIEVDDVAVKDRGFNWSVAKFTNETSRVSVRIQTAKAAFSA